MYYFLSRELDSILAYEKIINKQRRRLRGYIGVFILCKLPALVNRILNFAGIDMFPLFLIQALFDSLFGFFDSVVYGFSRKKMENCKNRICCCFNSTPKSLGVHDHLIQREGHGPTTNYQTYSSINERVYYNAYRKNELSHPVQHHPEEVSPEPK
jgi:hypothetical protein